MKDFILSLFEESTPLTFENILINLCAAAAIGFVIYLSYWLSHAGTVYSKKFNVSLVVLTVLTATVMVVIGNNVALSLGMVGALSIVRYRTAIKDSRDTAYIFWCIIAGICCGAGDYLVGACGTGLVFLILLLLGRIRTDNRILLVVRASRALEKEVETVVFSNFDKRAILKVKNTTSDSIEFIFEVSRRKYEALQKSATSIFDMLYALGNVEYVNIVSQSEEISA